jgi:hypothetical protein
VAKKRHDRLRTDSRLVDRSPPREHWYQRRRVGQVRR